MAPPIRCSLFALLVVLLILPPTCATGSDPWPRHTIDNGSRGADGIRLQDANGDGHLDIATGWEEGGMIRIYLHPGIQHVRSPWPAVTVGRVASPEDAVMVDLDRDGALDVVSSCEGRERTVYIHWAPSDPSQYLHEHAWQTRAIPASRGRQQWMYALPLDVDGQHGVDLVVGSKGSQAAVGAFTAGADPRDLKTWQYHRWSDAGWIMSLIKRDMDGDADLDVLVSDRKGAERGIFWFERNAAAGPGWVRHRIGGEHHEVMFLQSAALQINGPQLVMAAVRGGGVLLLERTASGTWHSSTVPLPPGVGTGKAVAAGDVDGDGQAELVFSCENAHAPLSGVRGLRRGQEGQWHDFEISGPSGTKFDRVELIDLDHDGDLDVLTCEESENLGVIWYENPGE